MRIASVVLGLALCVLPPRVSAQSSPEEVATAINTAVRHSDWVGVARLMHPAALRQLREIFGFVLEGDSAMGPLREQLFGISAAAAVAALPDTTFFAVLLEATLALQPEERDALKQAKITTLGHVMQGSDTALVVSSLQMTIDSAEINSYDVLPLIRDGAVWRGLLKADFTNMAAMLKRLTP